VDTILINNSFKQYIVNYVDSLNLIYTNIYLIGSRCWGFYSEKSDYDFFVETDNIMNAIRFDHQQHVVDLKFYNKNEIFNPYLEKYTLPRYSITENKFYNIDNQSIIDWIKEKKRMIPSYYYRHGVVKKWNHNLLNLKNDEIF
jgi:hypothetical protein